eukprot:3233294-Pleurochrysis_carterae.AAC.1
MVGEDIEESVDAIEQRAPRRGGEPSWRSAPEHRRHLAWADLSVWTEVGWVAEWRRHMVVARGLHRRRWSAAMTDAKCGSAASEVGRDPCASMRV